MTLSVEGEDESAENSCVVIRNFPFEPALPSAHDPRVLSAVSIGAVSAGRVIGLIWMVTDAAVPDGA